MAISLNLAHERRGRRDQPGAGLEQRAADQQHDVDAVEIKHFRNALAGHAAGRHRHGRPQAMPVGQGGRGQAPAGFRRIAEAPAMVGEDDRIGTQHPEQLSEQERRRDRGPGQGGMRHECHVGMLAHQPMEIGEAGDHRRHHDGIDAGGARQRDLRPHGIEIARQARHIAGGAAAQRRRNGFDPGREPRIGLVGEAMIVLDVVDAALRKAPRQRGELVGGKALRLEGRAGERARRRPDPAPQRRAGRGEARRTPRPSRPAARRRGARCRGAASCCRTAC